MTDGSEEWTGWLDRHGAGLVLFARQMTASHVDAEDVVQEAFVRFWRSRQRVEDPLAYLYSCVKTCALDARRVRRRQAMRDTASARPEAEPLFCGPLEQAERREAIAKALAELPDQQREVVVLRLWGGLTFPQIAQALAIPVDTAASCHRYALAKLRKSLAEETVP